MIIAIPIWNGRVSPVFDVARTVRIAELAGRSGEPPVVGTHVLNPARPAATLVEIGVDVLVCSAISAPLEATLAGLGIDVISDICGSPDEIIAALSRGDTALERFRAPGSRSRLKRSAGNPSGSGEAGLGTHSRRATRR
jgi:predicted Fe-Mo cluster-binding NifX family protein